MRDIKKVLLETKSNHVVLVVHVVVHVVVVVASLVALLVVIIVVVVRVVMGVLLTVTVVERKIKDCFWHKGTTCKKEGWP